MNAQVDKICVHKKHNFCRGKNLRINMAKNEKNVWATTTKSRRNEKWKRCFVFSGTTKENSHSERAVFQVKLLNYLRQLFLASTTNNVQHI